jgi:hypothetical protein
LGTEAGGYICVNVQLIGLPLKLNIEVRGLSGDVGMMLTIMPPELVENLELLMLTLMPPSEVEEGGSKAQG